MHTSLLIPYFSFPWTFPSHRFCVLINYQKHQKAHGKVYTHGHTAYVNTNKTKQKLLQNARTQTETHATHVVQREIVGPTVPEGLEGVDCVRDRNITVTDVVTVTVTQTVTLGLTYVRGRQAVSAACVCRRGQPRGSVRAISIRPRGV